MPSTNVLLDLVGKCDIYFEGSLISKELIIKNYADFLATSLVEQARSVSIALHTGSICFDIISVISATLACLSMDTTTPEQIIDALATGDMVLYNSERYRWCGIDIRNGSRYIKLQQDGRGKNGPSTAWYPFDSGKSKIKPYYGISTVTDGRGIKRKKTSASEFIAYMFGADKSNAPSVFGASIVIVAERNEFERLSKGIEIVFGKNKHLGLLDIVTASYYTETGEEYQYGGNPAKTEPVLKVTSKVSVARRLALEKHGNRIVGIVFIGDSALYRGYSETIDLLERKSLKFVHVATTSSSVHCEEIVKSQVATSIFACTKEYIAKTALNICEHNALTEELKNQTDNIANHSVKVIAIDGGYDLEDAKKISRIFSKIQQSNWDVGQKNDFLITARSLFNLVNTAVFPMREIENAIAENSLSNKNLSPNIKISQLWQAAETAGVVEYDCAYIADKLEQLVSSIFDNCPKHNKLVTHIGQLQGQKVAVIVPKAYFIETVAQYLQAEHSDITVISANRFDNSNVYDEIIVVGNFHSKHFNPFKCTSAKTISTLLYQNEACLFEYRKKQSREFAMLLNEKIGIIDEGPFCESGQSQAKDEELRVFEEAEVELERFIESISVFDVHKFIGRTLESGSNTLTSEICSIGRFVGGEQILFSKYYDALVYVPVQRAVVETSPESLEQGDLLVFAKRDDYTRNMVDFIYESLQVAGKLNKDVLDATEKAHYWKEALREHKENKNLSYHDVVAELRSVGSSLQEMSVRQWLIEESHIVGPRDESTLEQIAQITQDPYLLADVRGHFEACRVVRRQRKEILVLIGRAIADKLIGNLPLQGSILETVYENVDKLSETLELECMTILDEALAVPINMINRPINETEALI